MNITKLKLKAVVLTALMQYYIETNTEPPAERVQELMEFAKEIEEASANFPAIMDRTIEDDVDDLLGAIEDMEEAV